MGLCTNGTTLRIPSSRIAMKTRIPSLRASRILLHMPQRAYTFAMLVGMLYMGACNSAFGPEDDAAIRTVLAAQEAAWDSGDIPEYMEGYADDVCFTSGNDATCGRTAVTTNYLRKYPDKAAMGDLSFGIKELLPVGDAHAWLTGTWQLVRSADTLSGGFSLLWRKEGGNWHIIRDHSY